MSCANIRNDLAACLVRTDCVLKDKKTPQQCLHDDTIPEECRHLRIAYFECKRGMLDMRKRFRGLDPGSHKKEAADKNEVDVR